MKPISPNEQRARYSNVNYPVRFVLSVIVLLASLPLVLLALGSTPVSASVAGPLLIQAATPTTGVGASDDGVATPNLPAAVQTRVVVVPEGQETAQAPGAVLTPGARTPTRPVATTDGAFPWLPVVIGGLIALALLGFALMRPRRVATDPAPSQYVARVVPAKTTATTATSDATASAPAVITGASTVTTTTTVAATSTPPPAAPTTVTCPNCETVNDFKENFCHDCGQDLRPARSAIMAALAPTPEVVTDDMPYLETLDRADEQLEYVLSRQRVTLGTATNSDIVIDAAFKGWESVSPTHAELRREPDGHMILDSGSQNGTFVNDTRTGESILADGDTLRLGDVRFIFHIPPANENS